MDKRNYNNNMNNNLNQFQNYNNYSQNNQFKQRQEQKYQNPGFGSNISSQQQPSNSFQPESYTSFGNSSITVNNFRNTEAPKMNYKNQQFQPNQKEISRMTENIKGKDNRPMSSYREIKYDEFKQPRNTENVTTHILPRKSNVVDSQLSQKKNNLEEFQKKDKKYFNNLKYQKVKVTKKQKIMIKLSKEEGQKMILNKNIVFKMLTIITIY